MAAGKRKAGANTDNKAVEGILSKHILLPHQVQYAEDLSSGVDKEKIAEHRQLLYDLLEQSAGGSYNQKHLEARCSAVAAANEESDGWHLSREADSWAPKVALRLRAMMKHIKNKASALKTTPPSQWPEWMRPYEPLFISAAEPVAATGKQRTKGEPSSSSTAKVKTPATKPDPVVGNNTFGFSEETQMVYRKPRGKPKAKPDFALHWDWEGDEDDEEPATAVWADRMVYRCQAFTVGEAKAAALNKCKNKHKLDVHWQGTCPQNHDIKLKTVNKNGESWLALWHHCKQPPKQLIQTTPQSQEQFASNLQRDVSRMIAMGKAFAGGASKQQLEVMRRKDVKEEKDAAKASVTAKRPASAATAPASKRTKAPPVVEKSTLLPQKQQNGDGDEKADDDAEGMKDTSAHEDEDEESDGLAEATKPGPAGSQAMGVVALPRRDAPPKRHKLARQPPRQAAAGVVSAAKLKRSAKSKVQKSEASTSVASTAKAKQDDPKADNVMFSLPPIPTNMFDEVSRLDL
eukprot:TRINITY_DN74304_c0_g1_i1.p1 TRINITY_DN74304_c0_g1~~TRINITY_DN74304_c0_g1_i1.p1  ORF type:complete len:518 (-),score=115.34 TRINITY_DN74304_c0_g1_i1:225-1778(-)